METRTIKIKTRMQIAREYNIHYNTFKVWIKDLGINKKLKEERRRILKLDEQRLIYKTINQRLGISA